MKKLLHQGDCRITRAIDIVTILRLQKNLKTLLRLDYSRAARTLLNLQRRETVLDLDRGSHNESESSAVDGIDQTSPKFRIETKLEQELLDGLFIQQSSKENSPISRASS